jgi:hypothetical protein
MSKLIKLIAPSLEAEGTRELLYLIALKGLKTWNNLLHGRSTGNMCGFVGVPCAYIVCDEKLRLQLLIVSNNLYKLKQTGKGILQSNLFRLIGDLGKYLIHIIK